MGINGRFHPEVQINYRYLRHIKTPTGEIFSSWSIAIIVHTTVKIDEVVFQFPYKIIFTIKTLFYHLHDTKIMYMIKSIFEKKNSPVQTIILVFGYNLGGQKIYNKANYL